MTEHIAPVLTVFVLWVYALAIALPVFVAMAESSFR